jgi:hypothetical protein
MGGRLTHDGLGAGDPSQWSAVRLRSFGGVLVNLLATGTKTECAPPMAPKPRNAKAG